MEAIIIDSVSHEWDGKGGCLEINDHLAQTKYKGNTWAAWSETTPRHQKFIEAIVGSKAHIIATSRSKTETTLVDGKPKKVGTKDIQRDGFEYEMTLMFNIDRDSHFAMAVKDRTSLFIDRDPFKLSIQTGEEFRQWLETGIDPRKAELEREQAEQKARDSLYEAYLKKLDASKDSDTLKNVYEALKIDAKKLGTDYTKDLTDRIKSIKEEIAKGRKEPAPEPEQKEPQKTEEKPTEKLTKKDEKPQFIVTKEATKKFMETTRAIRLAPDHDTLMELMDEFFANLADKVTPEMVQRVEVVAEERLQWWAQLVEIPTAEAVQSDEPTESEQEAPKKPEKTYKETIKTNGDIVRKWSDGTIEIQKK